MSGEGIFNADSLIALSCERLLQELILFGHTAIWSQRADFVKKEKKGWSLGSASIIAEV